jgi:hypothetical protein
MLISMALISIRVTDKQVTWGWRTLHIEKLHILCNHSAAVWTKKDLQDYRCRKTCQGDNEMHEWREMAENRNIDPFLGNDRETKNKTTAVARQQILNKQQFNYINKRTVGSGVFCGPRRDSCYATGRWTRLPSVLVNKLSTDTTSLFKLDGLNYLFVY